MFVVCASACTIVLGAVPRDRICLTPNASLGFHAAYDRDTGQETGLGNALVGAYLSRIGLPYSAVAYITSASPDSMSWLSLSDAKERGIDVSLFELANNKSQDRGGPAVAPPADPGVHNNSGQTSDRRDQRAHEFLVALINERSSDNLKFINF